MKKTCPSQPTKQVVLLQPLVPSVQKTYCQVLTLFIYFFNCKVPSQINQDVFGCCHVFHCMCSMGANTTQIVCPIYDRLMTLPPSQEFPCETQGDILVFTDICTSEWVLKSSENYFVLLLINPSVLSIGYEVISYKHPVALRKDNYISCKFCKLLPHPLQNGSGKLGSYLTAVCLLGHKVSQYSSRQVILRAFVCVSVHV